MLTGSLALLVFISAIVLLLIMIIVFKMNAFIALLITSFLTAIGMLVPLGEIGPVIASGFGKTLTGIGIVTGLGVMLGQFLFESGGIEVIANTIIRKFGEKKAPTAVAVSGFLTGIPVFGDVVYVMFAPMLRVLSKKTAISMVTFACALSVATTCTYALVIPTPAPLMVSEILKINIGFFVIYAIITAFIGTLVGGILYGKFLDRQDKARNHTYSFEDIEKEEQELAKNPDAPKPTFFKAVSILLVPIGLILLGSFISENSNPHWFLNIIRFLSDKNIAMLIGVIYAAIITRRYIRKTAAEIMNSAADQIGLILLITGAGGAFGTVLQHTGIADNLAETLSKYQIPVLLMCFLVTQIIRCAQGSTTVALMTSAAILSEVIAKSQISPILCAIAICSGGIGLSLPNDSGFWAINRFFRITVQDTIRGWTIGGFIAGATCFLVVCILALCQSFLPGL